MGNGINFDGVNLADAVRGLPETLDRTKESLDSLNGALINWIEHSSMFSQLGGELRQTIGVINDLVQTATEWARAAARDEWEQTRLKAAVSASRTEYLGLTQSILDATDAMERQYSVDGGSLHVIQQKGLAYGVAADEIANFSLRVMALTQIAGSEEAATRALGLAYEGQFQRISRLLGPIRSMDELNEKMASGEAVLASRVGTTEGQLRGIEMAYTRLHESLGRYLTQSDLIKASLATERTALDFVEAASEAVRKGWVNLGASGQNAMLQLAGLKPLTDAAVSALAVTTAMLATAQTNIDLSTEMNTKRRADAEWLKWFKEYGELRDKQAKDEEERRKRAVEAQREADDLMRARMASDEAEAEQITKRQTLMQLAESVGLTQEIENSNTLAQLSAFNVETAKQETYERINLEELGLFELERLVRERMLLREQELLDEQATRQMALAVVKQMDASATRHRREEMRQEEQDRDAHNREVEKLAQAHHARFMKESATFSSGIAQSISGVEDLFINLGRNIAESDAAGSAEALTADVLNVIGRFAVYMGNATIASSIAAMNLANPVTGIGAGIALAAIGTTILAVTGGAMAALSDTNPKSGGGNDYARGGATRFDAPSTRNEGGSMQAGPRVINLFIGNGAIVGGDGRMVGRDIRRTLTSAGPSWED